GFWRSTLDVNEPFFSGRLLVRVNVALENAPQYVPPSRGRTLVIVPSLVWQITDRLKLKLDYQDFQRRETPPVEFKPFTEIVAAAPANGVLGTAGVLQNPLDLSDPGFLPYFPLPRTFNLLSPHDERKSDFQTLALELDGRISAAWIARVNLSSNKGYNGFKQTGLTSVNVDV